MTRKEINKIVKISGIEKIFFTSDTHFQHTNIIQYCDRPYENVETMNEDLILNWNSVVPNDGLVFHAGDFAMTSNQNHLKNLIGRLNGKIFLAYGNHDYQNDFDREAIKSMFFCTADTYHITVEDSELENKHVNFILNHYPYLYWRPSYINLHGHIHSGLKSKASETVIYHPMRYDIGVDNNNYTPISYNELKIILTKLQLNHM